MAANTLSCKKEIWSESRSVVCFLAISLLSLFNYFFKFSSVSSAEYQKACWPNKWEHHSVFTFFHFTLCRAILLLTHTYTNLNQTLTAMKWTEKGIHKELFALPLLLVQSNLSPIKSLMTWVTESLPLHHLWTAELNLFPHTPFDSTAWIMLNHLQPESKSLDFARSQL